jgi:hypothetical protein
MKIHRDRRDDAARRQRTARRFGAPHKVVLCGDPFAVGQRMRQVRTSPGCSQPRLGGAATCSWLAASGGSTGLPGPAFTALLASRLLWPITATSSYGFEL